MTLEDIKNELNRRGMTQADLAQKLCLSKDAVNKVLNGRAPLTDTLKRHIELLLFGQREALLVYRVNLTDGQVMELCGDKCAANPKDRTAAVEAVVQHNLQELVALGRGYKWPPALQQVFDSHADNKTGVDPYARQEPFA